ncbi:radical SAM protein [Anaerocolumna sp. AGMB13020]|uniref:radical SAM/SPASM domain-containing protein n=1 Tax=Anaerocolumna sp. AGMB13020 TaxID=3081750 RepID=UPI0029552228|nr:radical SAM protein [Anaerocolumna sp. AGMB13020]WOO38580.1 radical SAM protein [Anaerocolumna sp. AGMB13020]
MYKVDNNIWFDSEAIKIFIDGDGGKKEFLKVPKKIEAPSVHDEGWRPTIIYLAATTCNLKCKYCYAEEGTYGIHDSKRQFDFEAYVATYEMIKEIHNGVKAISFFGGEPILNFRQIKKFVEYLFATSEKVPQLSINTNATILNDEILEFICKYNIIIGTSIDGTKEIHDRNRVADYIDSTYDIVFRNLKTLKERGTNIYAQYTFTKQHLDSYQPGSVNQWCREMEEMPINTYELIPVSSDDDRYRIDIEDKDTREKYEQFCTETADYYIDKILNGDITKVPRTFIGLMIRILMQVEQRDCSAGHSISITPNRRMYPCHTFTEHEKYAVEFNNLSSLQSLEENIGFKEVREGCRYDNEACQKCIAKKVCGVWCKGLQNNLKGSISKELQERCILMNIYTRKIIRFLVDYYKDNKDLINKKLIAYNKYHKEI